MVDGEGVDGNPGAVRNPFWFIDDHGVYVMGEGVRKMAVVPQGARRADDPSRRVGWGWGQWGTNVWQSV